MTEAYKPTAKTHFHAPTLTLFELGVCEHCGSPVCTDRISTPKLPAGVKVWGESTLPPLPAANEYGGTEFACNRCKGEPYYIEAIKSEWAIIHRATGSIAGAKKSEKAARDLCEKRNAAALADNIGAGEHVAATNGLTTSIDTSKLGSMVVIRLAGDLGNGMKRGDHIALPITHLVNLINEIGVSTMAKTAERKTAKELIRSLIIKKKTDNEVLAAVHAQFPESSADKKHCTKYRRELFAEELIGADLAAAGSTEHREWAQANMAAAKKGPHGEYWKEQEANAKPAKAAPVKAAAKPLPKAAAKAAPAKAAPKAAAKAKAAPKAAAKAAAAKGKKADPLEI